MLRPSTLCLLIQLRMRFGRWVFVIRAPAPLRLLQLARRLAFGPRTRAIRWTYRIVRSR